VGLPERSGQARCGAELNEFNRVAKRVADMAFPH
jgi:hypothetical protein